MTTPPPTEEEDASASYIDYETFLSPTFSPHAFANQLVLSTNNASDTPLDLSTPLSRVLFDMQEIDTHLHSLTTRSALPLLTHTSDRVGAGARILSELDAQVATLNQTYARLEREVVLRWEAADEVRRVTERLWRTVRLGRVVGRCVTLGRQLEVQLGEVLGGGVGGAGAGVGLGPGDKKRREDPRAMVRAAGTIVALRAIFLAATAPGDEAEGLERIKVVATLRNELVLPAEKHICARAQQIVREFSMSALSSASQPVGGPSTTPGASLSSSTYHQSEETKSRTTAALLTLYTLSPPPITTVSSEQHQQHMQQQQQQQQQQSNLFLDSLTTYLHTAVTSSVASLSRSLASLPTLDRTLSEISARCQNIVALESLLESIKPPSVSPPQAATPAPTTMADAAQAPSSLPPSSSAPPNLLHPLLAALDTSSLPSYFWRALASSLTSRVADLLGRGGVAARALRANRERVRDGITECVLRGFQPPVVGGLGGKTRVTAGLNREREVAVMVGAVVGQVRGS